MYIYVHSNITTLHRLHAISHVYLVVRKVIMITHNRSNHQRLCSSCYTQQQPWTILSQFYLGHFKWECSFLYSASAVPCTCKQIIVDPFQWHKILTNHVCMSILFWYISKFIYYYICMPFSKFHWLSCCKYVYQINTYTYSTFVFTFAL